MRRYVLPLALASLLLGCGGDPPASDPAPAAMKEAAPEASQAPPATPPATAPDAAPAGDPIALNASASSLNWIGTKNESVDVPGVFTQLEGSLTVPGGDLSQARANVTIQWNGGIDSGNPARDANIWNVLFEALDAKGPRGQVSLNSLEVESKMLAVGESTTGNAFLDVGAGLAMTGIAVPVTVTHPTEGSWVFATTDTVVLSMDKLGLSARRQKLLEVCAHESLSDAVKISGSFAFGE